MSSSELIEKIALCAENPGNINQYENFAMQILSRSTNGINILAITSDTNKCNVVPLVGLNVGYNLANHDKKVLLINLDVASGALNDLLLSQNDNDKVIPYGNTDIILPVSTDFVGNMTLDCLKEKFSEYDFVILCVPSPKHFANYLAVPHQTPYYILVTKYFSNFYALNKCIDMINTAKSTVVGGIYTRLKCNK